MAGDDYGRPTTMPWAVTFTHPDAARIGGVRRSECRFIPFSYQLYESIVCAAMFIALFRMARQPHRKGDLILTYTMSYAVARFVLEFCRGDADRGFVFGGLLSTSQFIGVMLFVIALVLWFLRSRGRSERSTTKQLR